VPAADFYDKYDRAVTTSAPERLNDQGAEEQRQTDGVDFLLHG